MSRYTVNTTEGVELAAFDNFSAANSYASAKHSRKHPTLQVRDEAGVILAIAGRNPAVALRAARLHNDGVRR